MFSANQTPREGFESAASHCASRLRGRWDSRGPTPRQARLCSARTGAQIWLSARKRLVSQSVNSICPFQRLSVQEVPPLLNGDSTRSQQQRSLPSTSQRDLCAPQGSPQTFRSASSTGGAAAGSSPGASPQHTSASVSPLPDGSASPASSTHTSSQQNSLLLTTNTSNLSPSLIPSTVMSLTQISPVSSSSHGMTLPIQHSAPHSPLLPHSAPLSRALTPVPSLHQQAGPGGSSSSSPSHNPWMLKFPEMCATATLPLPRRPVSEMRLGGFQGEICLTSLVCIYPVCLVTLLISLSSQAPVFPGRYRYLTLHVWKPCFLTLPGHRRAEE